MCFVGQSPAVILASYIIGVVEIQAGMNIHIVRADL